MLKLNKSYDQARFNVTEKEVEATLDRQGATLDKTRQHDLKEWRGFKVKVRNATREGATFERGFTMEKLRLANRKTKAVEKAKVTRAKNKANKLKLSEVQKLDQREVENREGLTYWNGAWVKR
jgi:hypothetical protein